MTIKELTIKDITETFKSVIGMGDSKLSVNDIIDSSHEIILSKIRKLKGIDHKEKSDLIEFLMLNEKAEDGSEYDSTIHYQLKRFSEKYPDQKSFKFFLYRYIFNTFLDKENSSDDITSHYIKILEHNSDLFQLTDFISESGFGYPILMLTEVPNELVSVFRKAVTRFPKKVALLSLLAHLLKLQKNYQESLDFNLQYLEKLESKEENIDIDFVNADDMNLALYFAADLHYKIEQYDKSLTYCNRIIDQGEGESTSTDSMNFYYFDTLLIRIRINMKRNNISEFQKDYSQLRNVIQEDELKENYADILEYHKSLKN